MKKKTTMKQKLQLLLTTVMILGAMAGAPVLAQPDHPVQPDPVKADSQDTKSSGSSDAAQAQTMAELKLEYLITEDFWRFERQIQSEAYALPEASRYRIYLGNRLEDTYPASFLNAFPGIGVGSFSMGDTAGGWSLLGGELAGAALAVLGTAVSGGSASSASVFTGLGTLVIAGFRIYGIFRPMEYAGNYNARLQRALDLRPGLQASWPTESLDPAAPGLRVSWQF